MKINGLTFLDNTRLKAFKRCPQLFNFSHRRMWQTEHKSMALVFGSCWHSGLEAMYEEIKNKNHSKRKILLETAKAIRDCWIEEGMPPEEEIPTERMTQIYPRIPSVAIEIASIYLEEHFQWLTQNIKILGNETEFIVPTHLSKDIFLIGKIDKIIETRDGIFLLEHKTTSLYAVAGNNFQPRFSKAFQTDSQIRQYGYYGKLKYGPDYKGIIVDATLVHKKHRKFAFFPFLFDKTDLETWYEETCFFINQLLVHESTNNWPRNTEGCATQYGFCQFHNICAQFCGVKDLYLPPDFIEKEWKPFDIESIANDIITSRKENK